MRKLLLTFPLLLSFLVSLPAAASTESDRAAFEPGKGLDLTQSFQAQRDAIIQALTDGVVYKELSSGDEKTVRNSLARISAALGSAQRVDELSEAEKVQIFNEQETINVLLVKAHRDSRVICRREKPTGSHRPVNRCATVAERERATEASKDMLRHAPPYRQINEG